MNPQKPSPPPSPPDVPARRSFVTQLLAILAGAPLVLAPLGAGLAMFFDPLWRMPKGGNKRWIRLGRPENIPTDGTPALFQVIATRKDSWTAYPAGPVGAVYVRKDASGKLVALSAECPHLGCFVPFDGKHFSCPCHASTFNVDGVRLDPAKCASPRDLDPLELDPEKLAAGELWVDFKRFRAGQEDRVEKS